MKYSFTLRKMFIAIAILAVAIKLCFFVYYQYFFNTLGDGQREYLMQIYFAGDEIKLVATSRHRFDSLRIYLEEVDLTKSPPELAGYKGQNFEQDFECYYDHLRGMYFGKCSLSATDSPGYGQTDLVNILKGKKLVLQKNVFGDGSFKAGFGTLSGTLAQLKSDSQLFILYAGAVKHDKE